MFKKIFREKEMGDAISVRGTRAIADAQGRGRALASNNLPKADDNLELYIAPIRGEFEALLAEHVRSLGADHRELAEAERKNLDSRSERLTKQIEQVREEERTLKLSREVLPHTNYKGRNKKGLYAVMIILALGEALVTRPALAIFTANSNAVELLVFIMLTVVFVVLPHGVMITFRASENSKYMIPIRLVALTVILGGFFVLANMRSIYLQQIDTTTMSNIQAVSTVPMKIWWFIGLNLFFLFSSTLCVYMLGTSDENESKDSAQELDARLAKLREEIRTLDDELHGIPNRIYASERQWSQRQADRDAMKSRIASLFMQACSAFISENMMFRKDRPSCFDTPIRPLI
jgi:uncharacterized protein YlxW (UPF0749 family)